jgi:hypothetical protein
MISQARSQKPEARRKGRRQKAEGKKKAKAEGRRQK